MEVVTFENSIMMKQIETEEQIDKDEMGGYILREEYLKVLKQLKDKKALGDDRVPTELIKCGGKKLKYRLYRLVQNMHNEGKVPEDYDSSNR